MSRDGSQADNNRGYKSRGLAEPHKSQQLLNERVEELAKKRGISMAQLALAWSLANEFITAPIVGTTNLDSLKELIGEFGIAFMR